MTLAVVGANGSIRPRLYALADSYRGLADLLDDELEIDDPAQVEALQSTLDQVEGQLRHKVESIVGLLRELELNADMADAEAIRLVGLTEARRKKADWLRNYVLQELQVAGLDRMVTSRFNVKVRTNNPSVKVLDEAAIPDEFWREYEPVARPPQVNKLAILAHREATGEVVPGVDIVRTTRLEVK